MSEWKEIELGAVAEIKTGPFGSALLNEQYIKGGTPIITVEHIKDFRISKLDYPSVTDDDKNRLSSYILEEGDLVFSRVGSVDLSAITLKENVGWLFSSRMLRVRPDRNEIDPLFLSYYLQLKSVRQYIRNIAVGSTMPSINTEILKSIPIQYCSLEEQKQIAKTLNNLDSKISLLRQQNETLEELAQTLFKRWFVDFEFPDENGQPYKSSGGKMINSELGEIPEGWRVNELKYSTQLQGGFSHDTKKSGETTALIAKMGVVDGKSWFNRNSVLEYSGEIPHKFKLEKDDLLICTRDVTRDMLIIGNVSIIPEDLANNGIYAGSNTWILKSKIDSDFLFLLLKSGKVREQIKSKCKGSTIVMITMEDFLNTKFVFPENLSLFNSFIKSIKDIMAKYKSNDLESLKIGSLRDTLLPKLMSGEIEIKE